MASTETTEQQTKRRWNERRRQLGNENWRRRLNQQKLEPEPKIIYPILGCMPFILYIIHLGLSVRYLKNPKCTKIILSISSMILCVLNVILAIMIITQLGNENEEIYDDNAPIKFIWFIAVFQALDTLQLYFPISPNIQKIAIIRIIIISILCIFYLIMGIISIIAYITFDSGIPAYLHEQIH